MQDSPVFQTCTSQCPSSSTGRVGVESSLSNSDFRVSRLLKRGRETRCESKKDKYEMGSNIRCASTCTHKTLYN